MMRWIVLTAGGLLALPASLPAETPAEPPTLPASLPAQTPALANSDPLMVAPCDKMKVCAVELKPVTKVVYGSLCKEYCPPKCSLSGLFHWCCRDCGGCDCGTVRTRNVLTKKVVPACPVPTCVLKEVPVPCDPGVPPQP